MVSIPLMMMAVGPAALVANPIAAAWFGAGLGNAAWRITQDTASTDQAIRAGTVAAGAGVQGAQVAAQYTLGQGQLAVNAAQVAADAALGAANIASRHRTHTAGQITGPGQRLGGGFTNPAAAVAGGQGYAFALPDAPGAATRGSITPEQFEDYMRRAHETMSEQVREAYIRGGMDMASRGAQRAALEEIRDTEAQGSASLPLRPAAVPLTNAPVGQTPSGSSRDPLVPAAARASPQTYAANVPPPTARQRQNAELERALRTIAPRRGGLGLI